MGRSVHIGVVVSLSYAFFLADALSLPSFHVHVPGGKSRTSGNWWTQVGDNVYHAPTKHASLSSHIKDYYYAIGSYDALPDELRSRRVGGEGRWHIFHFPDGGASLLQTRVGSGGRRASVSRLHKLTSGLTLAATFPEYVQRGTYEHPLSLAGQAIEARAVGEVTTEIYTEYLAKLTSLPSRSWESQAMSDRAGKLLKDEFDSMGHQTCLHTFHSPSSRADDRTLVNVMAFVPGKTSGIVVVGAHYDSRPYAGPAPGAVDNGSGVAALLAMARAFKRAGVSPQKSIYFVGFAGEEAGLLGSAVFAEQLISGGHDIPQECRPEGETFLGVRSDQNPSIRALILDEIGWLSPNLDKATVNLESFDSSFDMMDHLLNACLTHNGENLTVVHNSAPFGSDHMSFLERGMHSVLSINGDDEGYPFYHSSRDTFNQVSPDYATRIARMNMGALLRMTGVEDTSLSLMRSKKNVSDRIHAKKSKVRRL